MAGMHAGGYGYLGVCHDSVAIVQAAMQEPVTLFPCLLAGQAEVMMSKMYKVRRHPPLRHATRRSYDSFARVCCVSCGRPARLRLHHDLCAPSIRAGSRRGVHAAGDTGCVGE